MSQTKHHALAVVAAIVCLLLTACGGAPDFKVSGTVRDGRTMNLRIVYTGQDNLNNVLTAARDGKFTFTGKAPDDGGSLVEIYDNDYRRLGLFYAENGDKIKVTVDADNPYTLTVEGNDVSERLCKWLHDNSKVLAARNAVAINAAIAKYVQANPEDIVSGLLMASLYNACVDPARATRLLESLSPEARPATLLNPRLLTDGRLAGAVHPKPVTGLHYLSSKTDSITLFNPRHNRRTLMTFSGVQDNRDSIIDSLHSFWKRRPARVSVLDVRFDADTFTWRRDLRTDSVSWPSGWVAGSVANPDIARLSIPTLPYFIVVDSLGRQIYRGTSLTTALKKAGNTSKNR